MAAITFDEELTCSGVWVRRTSEEIDDLVSARPRRRCRLPHQLRQIDNARSMILLQPELRLLESDDPSNQPAEIQRWWFARTGHTAANSRRKLPCSGTITCDIYLKSARAVYVRSKPDAANRTRSPSSIPSLKGCQDPAMLIWLME